jgi:hypothetical protein
MATIEAPAAGVNRDRVAWAVLATLAVGVIVSVVLYFRPPPQIGPDEAVFHSVDALFTAVTARDAKRLADCERRLTGYRDAGKLPPAAADVLDGVIRTARAGRWESAAETLYAFIQGQRREGATGPAPRPPARKVKR